MNNLFRRLEPVALALALLPFPALAPAARANTQPPAEAAPFTAQELRQGYRERTILAKPQAAHRASAEAAESREGLRVRRRWSRLGDLRALEIHSGESPAAAIARLRATGRYEYVQPNFIYTVTATPNDADFSRQWPLHNNGANNGVAGADIKAPAAWDIRTDASNVVVAVIDTGIRYDHPDLAANMWTNPREIPGNGRDDDGNGYIDDLHGINAVVSRQLPAAGDPRDADGHGTHVAGIIGAVGNNGTGIAGVAWRVRLMALRSFSGATSLVPRADGGDIIECIDYAIAHGAHIINASFGTESGAVTRFDPAQFDAMRRARDAGILVVAAAGNDGADLDLLTQYPASYRLENVLSVGNSTNRDDHNIGSNFGSGAVELFAPGTDILSTWHDPNTLYTTLSGTSMAAPHVAGALALLKAQFPGDTYRQLINRVLRTADPVSILSTRAQAGGRLNLDRALRSTDNRPFNDDFSARARVHGANLSIRAHNTGATAESEPAFAGAAPAATLWWEWTPSSSGLARLSTDGSTYDTIVGIFTGNSLGTLTPVAANDNYANGRSTSRAEFPVQKGVVYQIVVGGKVGSTDSSGLTLVDFGVIPENNNFAGAQLITGRSALISGANAQATLEPGEPRIRDFPGGKSLWYRWTAPFSARFHLALKSAGFDPLLAVYTGSALQNLTLVAASDDADREAGGTSDTTDAIVSFTATAGTTYHFQVDGKAIGAEPPTNASFTLTLNDALWQIVTDAAVTSAPTVGPDGALYVGTIGGWLHAFNADGRRRWPAIEVGGLLDTSSAALAPDGTLYLGAGPVSAAGSDAKLYAFDSATGTKKWEIVVGTGANANNAVTLAADGTIYVHSDEGRLFAFTDQGTPKWSAPVPGTSYASATVAPDGTIYLGSDEATRAAGHRLFALNPADGSTKWTFDADQPIYTAAALDAAGNIYFGTLTSARLYSLTPAGQQRWRYDGARLGTSSSPALSPDGATVYFAGYDGVLHAVDTATGAARWTFKLGDQVRASSPAVDAHGTVYIGCYDGLVYAVNADGTLRHTWSTGNIVRSSPAIAGNTLYIGSNDRSVYAFDLGVSTAGPWPQYRHNARRTGRALAEAPSIALTSPPQAARAGDTLTLTASPIGSGPFAYQWFKDGALLVGATQSTLRLSAVSASHSGNYSARVTNALGAVTSPPIPVAVRGADDPVLAPRLVNLSVRTTAGTASQALIVGFFVAGSPDKPLLVRGIGPSLTTLGVSGALADPLLQLRSASTLLAENDDWSATPTLTDTFAAVGAFPLANPSRDAAVLRALGPGSYTATITAASTATSSTQGIALAELYDVAPGTGARLANLSARSEVNSGSDILIAGFNITGNAPKTLLLRGIGPSLAGLGVSGALADPRLEIYQGGIKLHDNNDWAGAPALASAFAQVAAFPLASSSSRDAALLVSLVPGSYTVQLTGVNNSAGIALIEIYELP